MKSILFSSLLFVCIACHRPKPLNVLYPANGVEIVNDGSRLSLDKKGKHYKFDDLFTTAQFVWLKTFDNDSIGLINNLQVYRNNYFLLDFGQQKIFSFDSKGEPRFTLTASTAPGAELKRVLDFCVNIKTQTIDIFDGGAKKVVKYSLDGKFVGEVAFPYSFREVACNGQGAYIVYAPGLQNELNGKTSNAGVFIVNQDGKFERELMSIQPDFPINYFPGNCLSGFGDSIMLISNYATSIFRFEGDKVVRSFEIEYGGGSWHSALHTSAAYGNSFSFSYTKQEKGRVISAQYVALDGGDRTFMIDSMANNLFPYPVSVPNFFSSSSSMAGLFPARDFLKIKEFSRNWTAQSAKYDEVLTKAFELSEQIKDKDAVIVELPFK